MKSIALIVASLVVCSAQARVIHDDPGGRIADYVTRYQQIEQSGEHVVLAGECDSACTMVLNLPRRQVCAMPGAKLGFHKVTDGPGGAVAERWTRQFAHDFYPRDVASWFLSLPERPGNPPTYRSAASLGIAACR